MLCIFIILFFTNAIAFAQTYRTDYFRGNVDIVHDLYVHNMINGNVGDATIADASAHYSQDDLDWIFADIGSRVASAETTLATHEHSHNDLNDLNLSDDHSSLYAALAPQSSARNIIQPGNPAYIPYILRGANSQSADLFQFQNSSSGILSRFNELGYLGIGIDPTYHIDSNGAIRIGNTSTDNAGVIRWTGSDFEGYDGSSWESLTAGNITEGSGVLKSGSPSSGQISFWDTVNSISGDASFLWDNSLKELSILGSVDVSKNISASQLQSTTTTVAPLSVASTLRVDNLSAQYLGENGINYTPSDFLRTDNVYYVGNGSDTELTIPNIYGSRNVIVDVRRVSDYQKVICGIGHTSNDAITLSFSPSSIPESNEYVATVVEADEALPVGDNSNTTLNIAHSQNSENIIFRMFRNSGDYDEVIAGASIGSATYLTFTFTGAPTLNEFICLVKVMDATSAIGDGADSSITVAANQNTRDYISATRYLSSTKEFVLSGMQSDTLDTFINNFVVAPQVNEFITLYTPLRGEVDNDETYLALSGANDYLASGNWELPIALQTKTFTAGIIEATQYIAVGEYVSADEFIGGGSQLTDIDHNDLLNIGSYSHSAIDSHIDATHAHGAGTVVGTTETQTLTNKTINADSNTITNIDDGEIKSAAGINISKLGTGVISNTEFAYVNNATGEIQAQINSVHSSASTSINNHINNFNSHVVEIYGYLDGINTEIASVTDVLNTINTEIASVTDVLNSINTEIASATGDLATHISDTSTHGITSAIVGLSETQTLTNKTIDSDSNIITNIVNADIKSGAAIDATKIGAGGVTSTEFGYVGDVTGAIQAQINSLSLATHLHDDRYYTESETYNKTEINNYLNGINTEIASVTDVLNTINTEIASATGDLATHISDTSTHGITSAIVGISETQTLTNKTIDSDSNVISNIVNADIKSGAAIDAAKIHDGNVSNTEFGYINGATAAIQTQINNLWISVDGKSSTSHTHDDRYYLESETYSQTEINNYLNGINTEIASATGDLATHISDTSTHGITSTIVGINETQTLTNKTISADANTFSNIDNNEIKANAAIDSTKIYDGNVSNTEFGYINGVTAAIQTQINNAALAIHNHSASAISSGLIGIATGGTNNNTYTNQEFLWYDSGTGTIKSSGWNSSSFAYPDHPHDYSGDYISIITTPTNGNIPLMNSGGELVTSTYSPSSFSASGHNHGTGTTGYIPMYADGAAGTLQDSTLYYTDFGGGNYLTTLITDLYVNGGVTADGFISAGSITADTYFRVGTSDGLTTTRTVKDGSGNNQTVTITGGIITGWTE